ncbi:hypothetical protein DFJ58DRAFT_735312 [Suillus subalutaceus]|uniref:uncharacterized protein n=1 Tax=Suillus subalutaceus TaxID=48586 RepID=UPI001B8767AD|nr:uncharacterized protein DFJ58DRAFT_735312 [Suillus subalutaceus]KAG1835991.1 hypothetical protein DFJ58DRAFT_735312 [Suillus subalutaceus]
MSSARDLNRGLTFNYFYNIYRRSNIPLIHAKSSQPLNDGIRWQDQESRYTIPVQRGTLRIRLYTYIYAYISRSPEIVPSLLNNPVRHYPLRQIMDPPVYVMGESAGQKAFPHPASRRYAPSRNEPAGDDSAVEQ